MSIMGFAHRPGTAVEPTCSIAGTRSPRTAHTRSRAAAYHSGQTGSGVHTPNLTRAALLSSIDGVSYRRQSGWVRTLWP